MKVFLSTILLALASLTQAQVSSTGILPLDTTVYHGQLANGLSYYVKAHPEPPQRAEFRLVVRTGSLQEEADQLGLAHFVEHMAFNGTTHFEKNTLIDFLERHGSRFGADLNASTSFERTLYKLQVQTDDAAVVDTALQILLDWASAVTFDPEEVDRERGIIRSEWRSRLSSRQRLQQQTWPVLLQHSRYAERLPIGSVELIDTVATQRLIDYYQRWYQPRRMAIIAVGDFDAPQMVTAIHTRFGTLENTDTTNSPSYRLDHTPRQSFLLATDPEAPFTRWQVQYQLDTIPAGPITTARIRRDLCYNFYGGILNKRLARLREEAIQPFTFAQASFGQLPGRYRSFNLSGFTTPKNVLPALRVIATEVQRVAIHGFTTEELELEKATYLQRVEQYVKELDKLPASHHLGHLVDLFDRREAVSDRKYLPKLLRQLLPGITPEDVQALSSHWQEASILTTTISTGSEQSSLMPDSSQFYRVLDSIWSSRPVAYQQEALPAHLLHTLPPSPTNRPQLLAQDSVVDIRTYELSNGIRFYLKPTDFKEDEILFRAFSPGGLSLISDADYPSAAHAIQILDASGLADFSATTLYRMLADKTVNVGAYLGRYEEGLSGSSNRTDLESLFQLLRLYFTQPRFDSLATLNYQAKRREIMERIDTDPRSAFGRLMIDLQYDYHLRRPNTTVEELDQIDRQRAASVYAERFANPADFQFVFVGSLQPDTLLLLAERYLGDLPAQRTYENWQPVGATYTDQLIDTTVIAGRTPKGEVQLVWHGSFPYGIIQERYDFVSMRKLLDLRLREELREEMGGVYGVRVSAGLTYQPDSSYYFRLRFNAEPDMVDTLIQAALKVIAELAEGDISSVEVAKIQESQRKNYEETMRQNQSWLYQLCTRLARGDDWQGLYPGTYEALVDTLDAEALRQVVERYLGNKPNFRMVLLPEGQ
jgi:zinc protease